MAIGTYTLLVALDTPSGGPLDPPTWYANPLAEGGGLLTLIGHYHAGITIATRVQFKGRVFHVDSVLNRGEGDWQTQITCKEVFE